MKHPADTIWPVVLAGGGGTRLWPLSRGHFPKQFLALDGADTLLQQALVRVEATPGRAVSAPLVICNEEHRFLVAEQARQIACELTAIVLEPEGRNTAPALSVAAWHARTGGLDPILLMMPADHRITDPAAFNRAVSSGASLAAAGRVVTFGIVPERAETGYGYIELGAGVAGGGAAKVHDLAAFREKPDAPTAERFVASGNFLWNAGIFMMKASVWLEHATRFCPDIARCAREALERGRRDGDFYRLDAGAFAKCPSDSIDYAVMEPLSATGAGAAVVALDAGWSDVGSWAGLWDVSDKDADGNVTRGDVRAFDSSGSLILAEHRLVAALGCEDLVIVETADAVMVADRSSSQGVKTIVEWLTEANRDERLTHRRVYRPWGSYEGVDSGPGFQVKRIIVNPGAALSLQLHHKRSEHWIAVSGTALVTRGDEKFSLSKNESTYIPVGVKHRLENPGEDPVEIIEVQSGDYLGEDDIVRFEDRYNRVE